MGGGESAKSVGCIQGGVQGMGTTGNEVSEAGGSR
jgi:hypothetical protein